MWDEIIKADQLNNDLYDYLLDIFDENFPKYDVSEGRTVLTYLWYGTFGGWSQMNMALSLQINDKTHSATVYCNCHELNGTSAIAFDYKSAINAEKIFSEAIAKIHDVKEREVTLDGYDNYILMPSGDVLYWHCSAPNEWTKYIQICKKLFNCLKSEYPDIYTRPIKTKYESELYANYQIFDIKCLIFNNKIKIISSYEIKYDKKVHSPIICFYYGRKKLKISLSFDERQRIKSDLIQKKIIRLSDYTIISLKEYKKNKH
ncbi:MAG: hypothetical protein ACI4J6_02680 [Oscillospiraceae bacterium]